MAESRRQSVTPPSPMERSWLLRGAYHLLTVLLLWAALALVLLLDFKPFAAVQVGAVSSRDIRAASRFSYVSELRTERERDRAADAIPPIYSAPDRSRVVQQSQRLGAIADFLATVRSDTVSSRPQRIAYVQDVEAVRFSDGAAEIILTVEESRWQAIVSESRRIVDAAMRGEITESRLPTVLALLPNQISTALDDQQVQVVREWASGLIVPNSFLDVERTEAARQASRDAVVPIEVTFEAGQILMREGDVITAEQVEALRAMGFQEPTRAPTERASIAMLLLLLVIILALYLGRAQPHLWTSPRAVGLIGGLLVVSALGARLVMVDHLLLSYLYPTATVAMLLVVLMGTDVALVVTVLLALIIGLLTGSIEMVTYTIVGGWLSTFLLSRVERLGTFVRAGIAVGAALALVVACFALRDGWATGVALGATVGMALLNGAASASLALAGFYTLGGFLGATTFLQLMELARPTHPLFRELLLKAPGTYHHSIVVSNLAENAAEAVGADMLLVRVAAYYHDVGKINNPLYFVENQSDGHSLHDLLDDPYKSAEIIMKHVRDGVKLARKHRLPNTLVNLIQEHHGTTRVAWFYHKACEQEGEENVDLARFRYPGPRPQSREAAILMLADTVEATARAAKPAGAQEVDALIRTAIVTKLSEGQLDECDLSLQDIAAVRRAFAGVLQGIYHPRIAYPDQLKAPTPLLLASESANELQREPHPDPQPGAVG